MSSYETTSYYFCTENLLGKSIGMGEGTQVPIKLTELRQTQFVQVLKRELMKIKEINVCHENGAISQFYFSDN